MSETQTLRIEDVGESHVGQLVRIRGWVRNKPGSKGRYFLWLRDGSGEIQAVAEQDHLPPDVWQDCERIGIESSVIATGEVRPHPKHEGVYELALQHLAVIQAVTDYPIAKKEHGVDFLMKHRHLWIRGKRQSAILRIRSELHKAVSDFMHGRGFYRVDTPIFTPNACEGTTTLFDVDYHGDTVYLAQSGQLYNEADIGALGQVYCFGPTFRAERSKTRRHLLEFWMLEMEAAYFDHEDNTRFQEELMAYMVKSVLSTRLADLRILERDPAKLEPATETPYPRLRYGEAIPVCNAWRVAEIAKAQDMSAKEAEQLLLSGTKASFRDESFEEQDEQDQVVSAFRWGDDYGAPDEVAIGDAFKDDPARRHKPVFLTNFPVEVKGFYFKDELGADGTPTTDPVFAGLADELKLPGMTGHTIMGSDLLGPEGAGELIGASQREDDIERLEAKIKRHNLPREYLEWYVDLRRYGSVPHSGFGLGLERVITWICGGSDTPVHIRETTAFPRMLHHFEP